MKRREMPGQYSLDLPETPSEYPSDEETLREVRAKEVAYRKTIDGRKIEAVRDWSEMTVIEGPVSTVLHYNSETDSYAPKFSEIDPSLLEKVNAWARERKLKAAEKRKSA